MSAELIGQEIGRYKILELIGAGGMATVYKALDSRLEREVAIKVIRREAFLPEEMEMLLKRFERESKSLAQLSHPNIVGVLDYGEFKGAPYLVMEYLPGGTLKDWLGRPIPWRDAVQLVLPIAQALEFVHDRGIINRDIKPSNVLMTEKGQPMLTDFGLIKVFGDKEKDATNLTASGIGLGTPDYMAPEQWTGEATAQSDLYSLGVVLYEMITGHRPYVADTPAGVLLAQANNPLPLPKSYIPNLPKDVESVLLKALAKKPGDRYPNMHVFESELQKLLAGKQVSASTVSTEKLREQMTGQTQTSSGAATARKKWIVPVIIIGILGMLGVLGAGGFWFLSSNPGMLAPLPTATPVILPSPTNIHPTPTENLPVETDPPPTEPAETATPTEEPIPAEILDNKNVPMILIPAGEFTMGSDTSGDAASKPAHQVNVDAFYIDKYEVTNEMYDVCAYAVECRKPLQPGSVTRTTYFTNPVFANYPVIYIDWKMANAYCAWRGARLPTEAEWEKAARDTDERIYPWGTEELDCSYTNYGGCVGDTTPVDQHEKGLSPYGIFGMAGNVWEWTSSLDLHYPYDATDGREDSDSSGNRIARGGSWHVFGNNGNVRSDSRLSLDPGYYGAYVGIRCVRSLDSEQAIP